ncbi:DsbA family oxidoreductase [Microcella daejeonensis]|uniref:DsbA family oxidoreductase n=1 Tax=Microcella daejeonensis TaxID=2994971 RepID=A0A9E8MK71_9MICO|nr:DsbA family oxidoreductase [Microcella daejeonensis]WAB81084.1 DsbA family oxidoreductase [Microcella daejeonensis]
MSSPISVQIFSDVQCPWCYIGKRKFEAAVAEFDGEVDVVYRSFELAPDTPVDYEGSTVDYLSERKGLPVDQVHQMLDRVTQIAANVGLEYDFEHVHQTNTVLAHELLHFAKANGLQLELKERLLRAYFVEGRHVGRAEELADLAAEVGLDRDAAAESLADHRYLADVKADMAQAVAYGIQGVPFFVIDDRYGISGAQEPEAFLGALRQAAAERSGESTGAEVDAGRGA